MKLQFSLNRLQSAMISELSSLISCCVYRQLQALFLFIQQSSCDIFPNSWMLRNLLMKTRIELGRSVVYYNTEMPAGICHYWLADVTVGWLLPCTVCSLCRYGVGSLLACWYCWLAAVTVCSFCHYIVGWLLSLNYDWPLSIMYKVM